DPVSAAPGLLASRVSGVPLSIALYACLRWKALIDLTMSRPFSGTLLRVIGLVTIAIGSVSLLAQTHYKRVLAFSSIEHMGLACFALALGPLGVFAALLHLSGHALAKSTAFLLSGRVLRRYQ